MSVVHGCVCLFLTALKPAFLTTCRLVQAAAIVPADGRVLSARLLDGGEELSVSSVLTMRVLLKNTHSMSRLFKHYSVRCGVFCLFLFSKCLSMFRLG